MTSESKGILDEVVKRLDEWTAPQGTQLPAADGPSVRLAWNNFYGSWIDQGWNNFYGSWSDKGWNNFYGSWTDQGWNNFYGSWSDKGWNNFYGSWSDSDSGGGGGCFLTTACVEHRGLADDCYELQAMRAMRDTVATWSEENQALVREYYLIAPQIIAGINAREDSEAVWEQLYTDLVCRCIALYEENDIEGAWDVYKEYVLMLKSEYCEA